MTGDQQAGSREGRKSGSPGAVSRWWQQRMNAPIEPQHSTGPRQVPGHGRPDPAHGGRRSSQPRQSPLAWFADGEDTWLIVASGGRRHPDWYLNLMAPPDRASMELPGRDTVPVTPHRLDGADREQAWQHVTAAQPRYAKYQRNTDREYPVIRLTLR